MKEVRETDFMLYEKSNGILIARYKPGFFVNLEVAKQIVAERIEFTGKEKVVVLIYDEGLTNVSREARLYLASKEANKYIKAGAIINKSPLTSVLGNFFIKLNKPVIPCKLFSNEANAIKWLMENS